MTEEIAKRIVRALHDTQIGARVLHAAEGNFFKAFVSRKEDVEHGT